MPGNRASLVHPACKIPLGLLAGMWTKSCDDFVTSLGSYILHTILVSRWSHFRLFPHSRFLMIHVEVVVAESREYFVL